MLHHQFHAKMLCPTRFAKGLQAFYRHDRLAADFAPDNHALAKILEKQGATYAQHVASGLGIYKKWFNKFHFLRSVAVWRDASGRRRLDTNSSALSDH